LDEQDLLKRLPSGFEDEIEMIDDLNHGIIR
jgi:uncharacterized protein (DUF2461 family)